MPVPLYGDGRNVRDWLHVDDHCRAIDLLIEQRRERRGLQHRRRQRGHERGPHASNPRRARQAVIADQAGGRSAGPRSTLLPRHDEAARLGWSPHEPFDEGVRSTIEWYRRNEWWWRPIKEQDPAFKAYYQAQYQHRDLSEHASFWSPARAALPAAISLEHLPLGDVTGGDGPPDSRAAGRDRRSICSIAIAVRAAIRELRPASDLPLRRRAACRRVVAAIRAQPLEGNVLATEHLLDALRREGVRCRVLVPGSATVYAPSSEPISEDRSDRTRQSVRNQQARTGAACAARHPGRRHRRHRDALVQSHRLAADAGVCRAEHGAGRSRLIERGAARAGDQGRQP